ncbi:MAG: threonylcarbamoyl-AMP synthase [Clostridia bacterium]|nr:threonylcarbamoyl-AMP synthase [Clostridia bacterium]
MKTELKKPNKNSIEQACTLLKSGEIVCVPTETVYGLAGDATKGEVVKKIFMAKGRPGDNPLIVHIGAMEMLDGIVKYVPEDAKKLANAFWPGPLTIIMPKGDRVAAETCAGLDSVGVRMPSHPVAREIIMKSGIAFAAPSANLSGKPSPTNAADVFADMNGRIPLIIDGGESDAGVESTVVSVLSDTPIILRPGIITKEMMQNVLGKEVKIAKAITEEVKKDEKVLSPGMKYKHYSPNAQVILVKGDFDRFKSYVALNKSKGTWALVFDGEQDKLNVPAIAYGCEDNPKEQAHQIFSKLRELDKVNAKVVYARCPSADGVGLAVYNRMIRSAGFNVVEL